MCHCGNTGVERTRNKSQHRKLTLAKKILPPLLQGFELATFRSRVRRSYQQADLLGNIRPQSSQLAEPLWTDPGIMNGISVRDLISTQKTKQNKKSAGEEEWSNNLPKSSQARKKPPLPLGKGGACLIIIMPFHY